MSAEMPRRRPDAVTIIAIYHFVAGGLALLGALAILFFAILPVAVSRGDPAGIAVSVAALGLGFLFMLIFGIAAIIVGLGLLRLRSWARWGAIVLAILQLPLFPIGTIIGAAIIWYLLTDEGREPFEGTRPPMTTTATPPPPSPPHPSREAHNDEARGTVPLASSRLWRFGERATPARQGATQRGWVASAMAPAPAPGPPPPPGSASPRGCSLARTAWARTGSVPR